MELQKAPAHKMENYATSTLVTDCVTVNVLVSNQKNNSQLNRQQTKRQVEYKTHGFCCLLLYGSHTYMTVTSNNCIRPLGDSMLL
jgi:hypothetical protein